MMAGPIKILILKKYMKMKMKMKNKIGIIIGLTLCFGLFSCGDDEPKALDLSLKPITKTNNDTKVWAHFMLWYETDKSASDHVWGQHWWDKERATPYPSFQNGEWQNLYTRYTPLTGPYYSRDKAILEYQLLLMKYSGIDGVIADWYGMGDLNSPEDKTTAMDELYKMCKETGVGFAICYEDQHKSGTNAELIEEIQKDMDYVKDRYAESTYIKVDGQPLLLIFGPQKLHPDISDNWKQCFENINPKPAFYTLPHLQGVLVTDGVAKSYYNWSNNENMNASDTYYTTTQFDDFGGIISIPTLKNILVAMPGFNDCYNGVAGTPKMRVTPHNGGTFFKQQLDAAKNKKPKYLQLCTWNDYGEGTIIEPTIPNEAQNSNNPSIYLEQLQAFTGVSASKDVFPYIKRLYDLRNANRDGNEIMTEKLDLAFLYFRASQPEKAIEQLNKIQ
jgi:hypothetical protein